MKFLLALDIRDENFFMQVLSSSEDTASCLSSTKLK